MDIPLPGSPLLEAEDNEIAAEVQDALGDIPVPEDSNRYSPSVPMEDEEEGPRVDLSEISLPGTTSRPSVAMTPMQRRLLSMVKQTAAHKHKQSLTDPSPPVKPKKKKKVQADEIARNTISEIEELKRKETEMGHRIALYKEGWAVKERRISEGSSKVGKIGSIVDSILTKNMKKELRRREREKEKLKERERKEKRRKREKEREEKEREREREPSTWQEFTKAGLTACHFRRHKIKWTNQGMEKLRKPTRSGKVSLFEMPRVLRTPLTIAAAASDAEDKEFPSYGVRKTHTRPTITYSLNPDVDMSMCIDRATMMASLPPDILATVNAFLASLRPKSLYELLWGGILPSATFAGGICLIHIT